MIKSFEQEAKEFMNRYDHGELSVDTHPVVKDILDSHVTESEIEHAITNLKGNKSGGLDGLPAEVLKTQASLLSYPLCILFNYMFDKGEFPQEWVNGLTVPVPKGGDKNNPENYRRVTMLPLLGKVFEILVNNRFVFLKDVLRLHDPFNGGFKKGAMTSDNMFVLLGCIQKAQVLKQPLYVCSCGQMILLLSLTLKMICKIILTNCINTVPNGN